MCDVSTNTLLLAQRKVAAVRKTPYLLAYDDTTYTCRRRDHVLRNRAVGGNMLAASAKHGIVVMPAPDGASLAAL